MMNEKIKNALRDKFGWDDIIYIAENVMERIEDDKFTEDNEDLYEDMLYAIDDEIIYYSQQWTILQFYFTPDKANWIQAIENFTSDIWDIIYKALD